jgi:hypothetical protein
MDNSHQVGAICRRVLIRKLLSGNEGSIMRIREQHSAEEFLNRFYRFSDSLIRSLTMRYCDDGSRYVEICIATRDAKSLLEDQWVCVILTIHNVTEFGLKETRNTTNQVLSDGLHIQVIDGFIGVEFGGLPDKPRSIEEFRSSDGYIIADGISFDIEPYMQNTRDT